jgi:WD40 repeat protein
LQEISAADGSVQLIAQLAEHDRRISQGFTVSQVFSSAAVSTELNMIAAEQHGYPLRLYDLATGECYGECRREFEADVEPSEDHALLWLKSSVFSPTVEPGLLAALYHDGCLVVYNPFMAAIQAQTQAYGHQCLASSLDGRTLATSGEKGSVHLYEFETLSLLHRIVANDDYFIRSLAFTTDGKRLLDIRGSQCNVWYEDQSLL